MGWYSEVFDLVFTDLDREQANKSKIQEPKKEERENSEEDD